MSDNCKAIAEANYSCYQYHKVNNSDSELRMYYHDKWLLYHTLVCEKENDEYSIRRNSKWYNSVKNAKKFWTLIDWKGKVAEDNPELTYHEIYSFFKNVFKCSKLKDDPVLHKDSKEVEDCKNILLMADKDISMLEVKDACDNLGTGSGLHSLSPAICKLFPPSLKRIFFKLLRILPK